MNLSRRKERASAAGDWLLRLNSDDFTQRELGEWLQWYDADAENRVAFDALQREYEAWRATPLALRAELAGRLTGSPAAPAPRRPPPRLVLSIAAGIAALAVGVFLLTSFFGARGGAIQTAAYRTDKAQHRIVRLPDGSTVRLGGLSAVSLNFTDGARYLVLEGGEAFFEVARDPSRPFVVQVDGVAVQALGTAFNIRRGAGRVMVAVSEGAVRVAQKDRANADAVELRAGEEVRLSASQPGAAISIADATAIDAWQQGRLEFVNEPLESVIATVNRYSRRTIVLTDRALSTTSYTGTVSHDRIDEWLQALQDVFPVRVIPVGGETVLLSPRGGP